MDEPKGGAPEDIASAPTAAQGVSQRDILADMTAFQAEIDALRAAEGGRS